MIAVILHEGSIIAGRHIGMEHFLADGETVADAQQNQESEIQ